MHNKIKQALKARYTQLNNLVYNFYHFLKDLTKEKIVRYTKEKGEFIESQETIKYLGNFGEISVMYDDLRRGGDSILIESNIDGKPSIIKLNPRVSESIEEWSARYHKS
jgi:hypothetical protein